VSTTFCVNLLFKFSPNELIIEGKSPCEVLHINKLYSDLVCKL